MGSNGKTRNWVSSAANRIGIGRPEASNLPVNAKDEVISEKLTEMSHKVCFLSEPSFKSYTLLTPV